MTLPAPVPGLVIRYSYLWAREYARGHEEGLKDRPCAVILVTSTGGDAQIVTVLPITHSPPADAELAVAIPAETGRRLGLDDDRSWVMLSEANRFIWPGTDLRPTKPGDMASVCFGTLPYALFEMIRKKFLAAVRARAARLVPRSQ